MGWLGFSVDRGEYQIVPAALWTERFRRTSLEFEMKELRA